MCVSLTELWVCIQQVLSNGDAGIGFLISFFFLQVIQGVGVHTTVSVRVHDANSKSNANIVASTAGYIIII